MNPFELMKNFKNIQSKMSEMQSKMDTITAIGSAGGGMVKITLNGKMDMVSTEISDEVFSGEDRLMLQDLIRAAYTDASVKIKEKLREEMSSLTGGMDIPGMDIPPNMFG
ncbi:MAG: YbaB/EbfC family nucleoid-associated protein [Spirochaetales bacterium]|nr:YbaB/EbfC family nucleoid-associated protein [Spirochaetales bacterium]